jgi:REase_AHJR-like
MNSQAESLYEKKIKSIIQELSENGYKILTEISNLPFDLGRYHPDLIAVKNNEGIILDVKTSPDRLSIDRFQDIAEQISSHEGWRFLLVTLDDVSEKILPSHQNDLPSWNDLKARVHNLDTLIQSSFLEPALLFFWGILEAAMRKRAIKQNLPIWRFPTNKLLNHIYSSGEISISEFDLFKACLELRNKSAHGISIAIEPETLKSAYHSIQALVEQWGSENSEQLESV